MLVFPEQVLRGAIPNRDFLHLYGPGSLWVLAALFKVFSTTLWTERVAGYLQQLALVAAVYVMVRPYGRRLAVGGAAIAAIIIIPPIGLTALAWVGGVALGLWAMVAALRGRFLLAGVLGGFALLYRPDLVLAVGLGFAVLWRRARRHGERKRLLGGLGIGLSPYLIHIVMAGPGPRVLRHGASSPSSSCGRAAPAVAAFVEPLRRLPAEGRRAQRTAVAVPRAAVARPAHAVARAPRRARWSRSSRSVGRSPVGRPRTLARRARARAWACSASDCCRRRCSGRTRPISRG